MHHFLATKPYEVCVGRVQVKGLADEERSGREDATSAVLKMQSIIQAVREEMVEAQLAADE